MPSVEYSLFRVKMVRPHQSSFLHDELTPRDLLLKAILEKPSGELRKGFQWHIGNIQMFDEFTGYFAAGRTTTSTIEKFDEETSNFVEEELEDRPFALGQFDRLAVEPGAAGLLVPALVEAGPEALRNAHPPSAAAELVRKVHNHGLVRL